MNGRSGAGCSSRCSAKQSPHIIGTQEALRFQLDELGKELANYGEVGVGRDDGKTAGEYSAILYDRRRFEVLDEGTFWFAEEPAEPGTLTWGSTFARICSWARLRDKTSGREFYVFNQHWDHQSQESREKSAEKLLARIAGRDPSGIAGRGDGRLQRRRREPGVSANW